MATLNEIVFDIIETARNNNISDDTQLDERLITYKFNNQRSLWIRNEYNKPGRKLDPSLVQDFGCLTLVEVDAAECCDIETDCMVLRTEKKLPHFIDLHTGPAITRVGPVNKIKIPFNFVDRDVAILSFYNKYAKGLFSFLQNDYIYIIITDPNLEYIEYLNVRGVVEDPTKLSEFKCADSDDACFDANKEYPMSSWMIPYITEPIINQLLGTLKIPRDISNDANENLNK